MAAMMPRKMPRMVAKSMEENARMAVPGRASRRISETFFLD